MGILRESMIKYMEIRGYAEHTIESYVNSVNICAHHFNISPLSLSKQDIESFFLHLRKIGKSDNTVYMYYSALKLFYKINQEEDMMPKISFNRKRVKIPYILSKDQISKIIKSSSSLKYKTVISLLYSSGMRVSELKNLTLADIDFERKVIFIRDSKNKRNRYSIIGNQTVTLLKQYMNLYKPYQYLFYSETDPSLQIDPVRIRNHFKKLVTANKLDAKRISLHTLRHCFATHSLENGTDIFHIMKLLGHARITTTLIYLHMDDKYLTKIKSPIDSINIIQKNFNGDLQKDLFPLSA